MREKLQRYLIYIRSCFLDQVTVEQSNLKSKFIMVKVTTKETNEGENPSEGAAPLWRVNKSYLVRYVPAYLGKARGIGPARKWREITRFRPGIERRQLRHAVTCGVLGKIRLLEMTERRRQWLYLRARLYSVPWDFLIGACHLGM